MKQNEAVCQPGPTLLFFIFRFKNSIQSPKRYRDFRETGNWAGKTRNMHRFCCKKQNYSLISATNFGSLQQDDLLQDRLNVSSKTRKHRSLTRVAVIMQIKLHVSVARFTAPLDFACSITFAFVCRFDKMAWIVVSQISCQ